MAGTDKTPGPDKVKEMKKRGKLTIKNRWITDEEIPLNITKMPTRQS